MLPRACRASSSRLAPLLGLASTSSTPVLASLLHRSTRQNGKSPAARGKAPATLGATRCFSAVAIAQEELATETTERESAASLQAESAWSDDSPFQSLVRLQTLPEDQLVSVSPETIANLLISLGTVDPTIPRLWPREQFSDAMSWLGRHTLGRNCHERFRSHRKRFVDLYVLALARCGLNQTLIVFLKGEKRAERVPRLEPLIEELVKRKEWKLLLYLSSGDMARVDFTPQIAAHRIQAFLHLQRYPWVLSEYAKHALHGQEPLLESRFHLLQAHLLRRDLDSARRVIADLAKAGHADLNAQQLAILHGYRSLGFDFAIERQVLKDISNLKLLPPTAFLNGLLQLRIKAGDRVGAMAILKRFDLRAPATFSSRPSDAARPDLETLSSILGLCVSSEDLRLSHRFWTALQPAGDLSSSLVHSLVRALIRTGRVDDAVALLDANKPHTTWSLPSDFIPTAQHFNPILVALSNRDGIVGIRHVMAMMRQRGVTPDDTTVVHLANFARKVTRASTSDVDALVATLRAASPLLRPTIEQLDLVVHDAVSVAVQDVDRTPTKSSRQRKESYGQVQEFDGHRSADAALGLDTLSAFRQMMHLTLASLDDRKAKATAKAFASRLRFDASVARDLPAASRILELMLARGFRPEPMHFAALMQGYAAVGAMGMAEDTLDLAVNTGIRPNIVMLTILIDGYGRWRKPDAALSTFRKLARLKIAPDEASVTAVIHALHRAGRYKRAAGFAEAHAELAKGDRQAVTMTGYARIESGEDIRGLLKDAEAAGLPFDRPLRRMVLKARNRVRKALGEGSVAEGDHEALRIAEDILKKDTEAKRKPAKGVAATKRELARVMHNTVGTRTKRTRGGRKVRAHREHKKQVKADKAASHHS